MNKYQRDVHHLHSIGVFNPKPPARPTLDGYPFELRCHLLLEEVFEFVEACGVHVTVPGWGMIDDTDLILARHESPDMVAMIDAIVDIEYVNLGAAVAMGTDLDPFWDEVQRANADKANGPLNEHGKRLKPEGWRAPNIEGVLARVLAAEHRADDAAALEVGSMASPKPATSREVTNDVLHDEVKRALSTGEKTADDIVQPAGLSIVSVRVALGELYETGAVYAVRSLAGGLKWGLTAPSDTPTAPREVFVPEPGKLDFDTAQITPIEASPSDFADAGIISRDVATAMDQLDATGVVFGIAGTKSGVRSVPEHGPGAAVNTVMVTTTMGRVREMVLSVMPADPDEGATSSEIAHRTGMPIAAVEQVIANLFNRKHVIRHERALFGRVTWTVAR